MWKLTISLLISVVFTQLTAAQIRPDSEGDGIKGHVKTVRITTVEVSQKDGTPVERTRSHEFVSEYDESGYKTEERRYINGKLREKKTYSRDDSRTRTSIRFEDNGKVISRIVDSFDAQGKPGTGAVYDADGALQSRSVYTYDADGKFLEAAIFNADGTLKNKTIFKHDSAGKETGFEVYDASGKLLQKQTRTESESTGVMYGQIEGDTRKRVEKPPTTLDWDAHGNWIKRSVPTSITRGSETVQVLEIINRDITYY